MVKRFTYCGIFFSLAFLSCSPGIVDPPPASPGKAAEYFWSADISTANYERLDLLTGDRSKLDLDFRHDSTTITTVSGVTSNATTEQFRYRITNEGIFLDNTYGANSLLPLPEGFKLVDTISRHLSVPRKVKHVLVIDASKYIAVDEDKRLYYTSNAGDAWSIAAGDFDGNEITSLELGWYGEVYAGTESKLLYRSTDFGKTWKRSPITFLREITAMTTSIDSSASIYFAVNEEDVYSLINLADTARIAGPLEQDVTALAATLVQGNYFLTAGTKKGIYFTDLNKLNARWYAAKSDVVCLAMVSVNYEKLYTLVEESGAVKLLQSVGGGSSWSPVQIPSLEYKPQHLAYEAGWLLLASEKVAYLYDSRNNYVPMKVALPVSEIYDLSSREGIFALATDKGIFRIKSGDTTWENISSTGITEEVDSILTVPGSIILMKTDEHGLDSGRSWEAGMCQGNIQGVAANYYATAFVHEAQDSLIVEDKRYADVIPISYIFSSSPGNTRITDGTPYMVIYYARNIGPVLIEQFIGKGNRVTRIYRTD